MPFHPLLHFEGAVSAIVVHHQVQRRLAGKLAIDAAQELQKLLMPVALIEVSNNFAFQYVESSEKSCGSVPFVVMSHRAAAPLLEGQSRLSAIQSLNLALFVNTNHDRLIGRT